jgi:hypothetical protein
MCIYIYIYIYIIYIYIHIYILHMYIYKYTHTYIYIVCILNSKRCASWQGHAKGCAFRKGVRLERVCVYLPGNAFCECERLLRRIFARINSNKFITCGCEKVCTSYEELYILCISSRNSTVVVGTLRLCASYEELYI